jgi:hypothetical protein
MLTPNDDLAESRLGGFCVLHCRCIRVGSRRRCALRQHSSPFALLAFAALAFFSFALRTEFPVARLAFGTLLRLAL